MENMIGEVNKVARGDGRKVEAVAGDGGGTFGFGEPRGGEEREQKNEGNKSEPEENIADDKAITIEEETRNNKLRHMVIITKC